MTIGVSLTTAARSLWWTVNTRAPPPIPISPNARERSRRMMQYTYFPPSVPGSALSVIGCVIHLSQNSRLAHRREKYPDGNHEPQPDLQHGAEHPADEGAGGDLDPGGAVPAVPDLADQRPHERSDQRADYRPDDRHRDA